ncbi:Dephospho-CoA kinase [Candidatus Kinetoplastibacterium sorsogonicusi]|uniref:Dephospho-CoA kinase n=1 Tax=Candidatus Kinetoplastidibacterium kentomonadis TaxID=1576550 RepID=A0A3S7J956_9PROT|nr:dephospho-CoA kinase [Candidatus Kinetoplastibacterium sorsogonicusi]AWD32209.1 Dephospho-CoA kinase [Candidatus Kinetoplastibacterium sorsogonicusi]
MLKIGLTGGIGSGKTTVSNMLNNLGVKIIDTDIISHSLTTPNGEAIPLIKKYFGNQSLSPDGSMNRIWMRSYVFSNNYERKKLEFIMHPLILKKTKREIEKIYNNCNKYHYLVIVVPLLLESSMWINMFDKICVVDCDLQTQIDRTKNRPNMSLYLIKKIIKSQIKRSMRLRHADYIINNSYNIKYYELIKQIKCYHKIWHEISNTF